MDSGPLIRRPISTPAERAAASRRVKLTKSEVDRLPFADDGKQVCYLDTELTGFGIRVGTPALRPVTSAPSEVSQSVSQPPLNPVCPVTNTRRPCQNVPSILTIRKTMDCLGRAFRG